MNESTLKTIKMVKMHYFPWTHNWSCGLPNLLTTGELSDIEAHSFIPDLIGEWEKRIKTDF